MSDCVSVMFALSLTGFGDAELVTARSTIAHVAPSPPGSTLLPAMKLT